MPLKLVPKPNVAILSPPLFVHPSRNYAASVLFRDIKAAAPRRALDAGAGKLKTYRLFPAGSYHGVGIDRRELQQAYRAYTSQFAKRGEPILYVLDLNGDFHFLGAFDLAVSTSTLDYLKDPVDTVVRLANLLDAGGTLLFEISASRYDALRESCLSDLFETATCFPFHCLDIPDSPAAISRDILGIAGTSDDLCDFSLTYTDEMKEKLFRLSKQEMTTPCEIETAQRLYVACTGRLEDHIPTPPTEAAEALRRVTLTIDP